MLLLTTHLVPHITSFHNGLMSDFVIHFVTVCVLTIIFLWTYPEFVFSVNQSKVDFLFPERETSLPKQMLETQ